MANNIEWAHASMSPGVVDPDDIPSSYEGLSSGEIGAWLGSDYACILYGTPDQVAAVGKRLIEIAATATPYTPPEPITMTRERLDYLRTELEAERLSWGEVAEVQVEFEKIDPRTLPDLPENATTADMLDEIEVRIDEPNTERIGGPS